MWTEVSSISPDKHENHEPPGLGSRGGTGKSGAGPEADVSPALSSSLLLQGSGLAVKFLTWRGRCARLVGLVATEADLPASGKPHRRRSEAEHGKAWKELGGSWGLEVLGSQTHSLSLRHAYLDLKTWALEGFEAGEVEPEDLVSNT